MNKILKNNINNTFVNDVCSIIEKGRQQAYTAINASMIETYWKIGKRIVEEEQCGNERAEYGQRIIEHLSQELTKRYGKGFSKRYLAYFRKFYLTIDNLQILQTCLQNLTWSHILTALRAESPVSIRWYLQTASMEMWSVRTLDRNISTQYFERHFKQPQLPMKEAQPSKLELLKNPMITHQDVGQMDMYVRMYDEMKRTEGDNPTIGIVLCSETSKDIAKYSILNGNEQLFAAKYVPLLPTEEELRKEIERQKEIFLLQQKVKEV